MSGLSRHHTPGAQSPAAAARTSRVVATLRSLSVVWLLLTVLSGSAHAQRTDVIKLNNGDRITGEVESLKKAQLQFKTDDAGTIYLEWDKILSLEASGQFDVTTVDGRRYFGSLEEGAPGELVVREGTDTVSLKMIDVTLISPIGVSFWKKLDGSLDIGFSYTRSSHIAQGSFNSSTVYRNPAFEMRLTGSATITQNEDDGSRDDRGTVQASYLRFRGQRLFVGASAGFESNESLGLILRSQVAGVAGARMLNTNRAQLFLSAGLAANNEQNVDADSTQNLEGIFAFRTSYYTYDRPRTNLDIALQYYPSLSDWGRQRIQFDASAKREIWKDVFLAMNVFDTYDSRPPATSVFGNDFGVTLSFGWSY